MGYNVYQQVFGLSLASNGLFARKGTEADLQKIMQAWLQTAINGMGIGSWSVVWGPTVWKNQPLNPATGADNTWFVANNPSVLFPDGKTYNTYVVAIAGTAKTSEFDMRLEDWDISEVVDFNAWLQGGLYSEPKPEQKLHVKDATNTYIAHGTAIGTHQLLINASPPGAASPGKKLDAYLATLPSTAKVVFTGHSLGGALCPTLALALLNTSRLNNFAPGNVLTFPTAGPTPGNQKFAALFASRFPPQGGTGYQGWNRELFNTLDIVPQSWCTRGTSSSERNLNNIPGIYNNHPVLPDIKKEVEVARAHAELSRIVYTPLQGSAFTGAPVSNPPKDDAAFRREALKQHMQEYGNYIGISAPRPPHVQEEGVAAKTEQELAASLPVLRTPVSEPTPGAPVTHRASENPVEETSRRNA